MATATAATTTAAMVATALQQRQLQGKRVLVTGAGRGIGRAIALICHQEGARVAITSRTPSELKETIALARTRAAQMTTPSSSPTTTGPCTTDTDTVSTMAMYVTDVKKKSEVERMVQAIVDDWGGIDIAVNNAGGSQGPKGTVDELDDDGQIFRNLLQLNVVGVHLVTSAVVRLAMKDDHNDEDNSNVGGSVVRGQVLNISSKAGKVGFPNMSFYVASKFALEGMTSSWSKELKDRKICVNSLSPGMVDTKSFPKPPGKPGVRSAESIRDCLLFALRLSTTTSTTGSSSGMDFTGHYVHADELDLVREKGIPDVTAWKPIDETPFSPSSYGSLTIQ